MCSHTYACVCGWVHVCVNVWKWVWVFNCCLTDQTMLGSSDQTPSNAQPIIFYQSKSLFYTHGTPTQRRRNYDSLPPLPPPSFEKKTSRCLLPHNWMSVKEECSVVFYLHWTEAKEGFQENVWKYVTVITPKASFMTYPIFFWSSHIDS